MLSNLKGFRADRHIALGKKRIALDVLVLLVVWGTAFGLNFVTPRIQPFDLDNWEIKYPMKPETVTDLMLAIISVLLPLVTVMVVAKFIKHNHTDLVLAVLAVLLSTGTTGLITNIIKIYVGGLRPDFLARCQPSTTQAQVCMGNPKEVLDGRRSFPSGHSSMSAAGLVFLTLYLYGALKTFSGKAQDSTAFKFVFPLIPTVGAALVALSRVRDDRHHLLDVTVGYLLGAGIAYLTFRNFYLPLIHEWCNTPIYILNALSADGNKSDVNTDLEAANSIIRHDEGFDPQSGNSSRAAIVTHSSGGNH
ncbi:hypothetical protein RI367_002258 [Sorochytrium milnesiophthora]